MSMAHDERKIRAALGGAPRTTDSYAREAGCSLGRATEILNRLHGQRVAVVGTPHPIGMTWKAAPDGE